MADKLLYEEIKPDIHTHTHATNPAAIDYKCVYVLYTYAMRSTSATSVCSSLSGWVGQSGQWRIRVLMGSLGELHCGLVEIFMVAGFMTVDP